MDTHRFPPLNLFALLVAASGGILFGYHTGILSGILHILKTTFHLSAFHEGVLMSFLLLGGLIGAFFGGGIADRWGRKKTLLIAAIIFMTSAFIQAISHTYIELLTGRFLAGTGVGLVSVVSPLYIAEIAPAKYRGGFVSVFQLMVSLGVVLAYTVNFCCNSFPDWRVVYYIGMIPASLLLVCLFFIPESTIWLDKRRIKQSEIKTKHTLSSHLYRILIIGLLLSIFQQITGINTVFYYAPKVFGFTPSNPSDNALVATLALGLVSSTFVTFTIIYLDKWGRRLFLLSGVITMIFGQALMACHECFFAKATVLGALIYAAGFAISLGPITWVILSEIYPLSIRGKAMSIAIFANWLFNYLVTLTFPIFIEFWGMSATFLLYGCISLLCLVFVYFYIPETKGKTLEDLEKLFMKGKL